MKYLSIYITFLLIITTIMFCSSLDTITGDDEDIALILGDTLSIPFGRTLLNQEQNLSVIFDALMQDSRCPQDLRCFWEGNARIQLQVNNNPVLLDTYYGFQQDTVIDQFYIKLIYLNPRPLRDYEYPQDKYIADLYIEKAD